MPYSPPPGSAVALAFPSVSSYSPPPGSAVTLEFAPPPGLTILSVSVGDTAEVGAPALAWTQFVDLNPNHDGIASAEEFSTTIEVDFPRVKPTGIFSEEAFGTGFIYLQQQFVTDVYVPEYLWQDNANRVRDAQLTYLDNLPDGGALTLAFVTPYYPPPGAYTVLEFNQGATPTIRPQGIVSQEAFGTSELVATPVAIPTGFDSSEFGTAEVYNLTQIVYASGLASTNAFGTATVFDPLQYITHTGASYSAFGTATVYCLTQISYPTGIPSALAFGTATVENKNRELTLSGINALAFGTAHVFDPLQYLRPPGFNYQSWGTASIINNNRYLSPTGTKFDAFGTQHVENSLRYLYAQRIDPKGFGTTTIYNLTQYKTMTGFKDDVFGTAYIIGPRYLRPTGWKSDKFLPTNAVSNYYRTVYPTGVPAAFPVTGSATIYNKAAFVFPDSVDPEDMPGAIVAMPPFDIIDVTGNSISESEVTSEADIYYANANHLYLRSGIYTGAVGTPTLTPAMITINAGILGSGYGRPTVSNYTRYVIPPSIGDASRYGTQWASHYIRYVEPKGWDSSVVWYAFGPINLDGTVPGVKGSAVYLYPTGFDASGTTYDPCGFPRTPPIPRPSVHP